MKKKFYIITAFLLTALLFQGCGKKKKTNDGAILKINSIPPGAKVIYKGKELGTTPFERKKVHPAVYILKIEKANYSPKWVKIACSAKSTNIKEVVLTPVTASLMIKSNPPRAKVLIDGKSVGETPLILHNQSVGVHSAVLRKYGYSDRMIDWKVENSRPQTVSASLQSNMGGLTVNSSPAKANVFIDKSPRGTTPFKGKIEHGKHKIRIEKGGYAVYEEIVNVIRDKDTAVNIKLQILPGSITVNSQPSGAMLYINGRQIGSTPATLKNLEPGTYSIKLSKTNYDSTEEKAIVRPGQHTKLNINLDSITGGIDLIANPPGVTIYLDGKKLGMSEADENKKISKVFRINNLTRGIHVLRIAHKRAVPDSITKKVRVHKGRISRIPPINMWIANAVLKLKNGKSMTGRLVAENPKEIFFEPEPGVRQGYDRREIESISKLKFEE